MHKALKGTLATVLAAGTIYMVHQASADQNYLGEGGNALNPNARGLPPGTVEGQLSYFDLGKEDGGTGPKSSPTPSFTKSLLPKKSPLDTYRFHYYGINAAGRVNKHIEASGGISRLRVTGNGKFDGLTRTGLNAALKWLINPDAPEGSIKYAVGGGYDRALLKNWHAYGVASKAFGVREGHAPWYLDLGVRWDRFDLDDVDGPSSSKVSAFAGAEIPLTKDGTFSLTGEIQSRNSEFTQSEIPFSVGVKYQPKSKTFNVAAGLQRQGLIGDEGLYAKVGYMFH